MCRRTIGHYPFSLKFNRREGIHQPPLTYDTQITVCPVFFLSRPPFRFISLTYQQNFAGVCLLLVHLKIKMHQQTLPLIFFSALLSLHSSPLSPSFLVPPHSSPFPPPFSLLFFQQSLLRSTHNPFSFQYDFANLQQDHAELRHCPFFQPSQELL